MTRRPRKSELQLHGEIIEEPKGSRLTNALILLHGIGDSEIPFARLGRNLNLPETVCIALRGPKQVPFMTEDESDYGVGFWMWGDDITFDEATGGISNEAHFLDARNKLSKLLGILTSPTDEGGCGFKADRVLLFGFGQGGMLALDIAATYKDDLRAVVSVGGVLHPDRDIRQRETSVLLCGGDEGTCITKAHVDRMRLCFKLVKRLVWQDHPGDAMPRSTNRKEWYPIMDFFSRHLAQMSGVPSGTVEL